MDWIANGEGGASVRAKLNSIPNNGTIALSSGSFVQATGNIRTSTSFVDLPLDPDAIAFRMLVGNIIFDVEDNLGFQFSLDGGITFIGGNFTGTDYLNVDTEAGGNGVNSNNNPDYVGHLQKTVGNNLAGLAGAAEFIIYPGVAGLIYPFVKNDAMVTNTANSYWSQNVVYCTASKARATTIRVGPYMGDGTNFTYADYILWGLYT